MQKGAETATVSARAESRGNESESSGRSRVLVSSPVGGMEVGDS